MSTALGPYAWNTITTGDAVQLGAAIPDASVDAILCDPVYNIVDQYHWVAHWAARVLKPGGSLIAQSGHIYRYACERAMEDATQGHTTLDKRPLLTEVFTGGFASIWMHRALRASHPYIWLEKGLNPRRAWLPTMFFGMKDKRRHRWGDGERGWAFLLSRLKTHDDFVVVDPFCGGATVPAVCVQLHCRFVAFEIDPHTAARGRERVAAATPMLLRETNVEQWAFLEG